MKSLLMLLLVPAIVQLQLLPSVVGAASKGSENKYKTSSGKGTSTAKSKSSSVKSTGGKGSENKHETSSGRGTVGVFQDKAGAVDVCKAKSCNEIQRESEKKQKKICKENKEVRQSCPQTCDDVSVFKKECPSKITSRTFDKNCSVKYQHNRQCDYDYKYTGCTWNDLQCTSQQGYTCDYESLEWKLATTIIEECENHPPDDLPVHEECTPCSDTKPAMECPEQEPTNQQDCSDYENDLNCNYSFMLTGCDPSELECSPLNLFTCTEDKRWAQMLPFYPPCPSNTCPTLPPDFGSSCHQIYQDGLDCKYGYVFTGCNDETLACSPEETYTCDYDSQNWLLATVRKLDRQVCDTTPKDWPVFQQCTWPEVLNMQYDEAKRIIMESDTVGYLTKIEMIVKGTPVTEDYSFKRVRVIVKNNTAIVVEIPKVG